MFGREIRPRRSIALVGLLLLTGQGGAPCFASDVETVEEDEPILLGLLNREEIEAAMPDWVMAEVEANPDTAAAGAMVAALDGAEVTVFFGSWCSDSARELARLWRALDELGALSPDEIRYIGVDRDKSEPAGWVEGRDLRLVPTFVVSRQGEEVGRIVESSPNGIEQDLLALLRGDATGLITNSEDLEPEGEGY